MKKKDRNLLAVVFGIAILISVIAPFVASENPDGLESTSERFENAENKNESGYESPLPDYGVRGLGGREGTSAIALILGTVLTLVIVLAMFYGISLVKRSRSRKDEENSEKDGDYHGK